MLIATISALFHQFLSFPVGRLGNEDVMEMIYQGFRGKYKFYVQKQEGKRHEQLWALEETQKLLTKDSNARFHIGLMPQHYPQKASDKNTTSNSSNDSKNPANGQTNAPVPSAR